MYLTALAFFGFVFGFAMSGVFGRALKDEAAAQRYLMLSCFSGWALLNLGGYV